MNYSTDCQFPILIQKPVKISDNNLTKKCGNILTHLRAMPINFNSLVSQN